MAQIFRPTYYVDPATGKRVNSNSPGAVCKTSPTWWIRFYTPDGKRQKVKGYRDKKATENKASELEKRAIRLDAGIIDITDVHAKRPLAEHLAEYVRYLTAKGNTEKHVSVTERRVQSCLDDCKFIRVADVQPSAILSFLEDLRRPTEGNGPKTKGASIATANYYMVAVKGFTRWLWKDRRIASDPLAGLSKLANGQTDIRHERRELSQEEFSFLLNTTAKSGRAFRYLTGVDRYALYLTAAGTGFRVSELASLCPANFDLSPARPAVRVAALNTKNRKEADQPLSPEVANVLRRYLSGRDADAPVWPGTWSNEAAAKMIRLDLAEARKKWLASIQDARQRTEAEGGDFLTYRDATGLVADFHSLRHLYISRVVRSGVSPKVAQELARHSDIRLTLGRYAHVSLNNLTDAVNALPDLLSVGDAPQAMRATGTHGPNIRKNSLGPFLGPQPAFSGDSERRTETEEPNSQHEGKRGKIKLAACFPGKDLKEAPPGFEPGMADLQNECAGSKTSSIPPGSLLFL